MLKGEFLFTLMSLIKSGSLSSLRFAVGDDSESLAQLFSVSNFFFSVLSTFSACGGDLRHPHGSRRISGHTAASAGLSIEQCLRNCDLVPRTDHRVSTEPKVLPQTILMSPFSQQQRDCADAHADEPPEPAANANAYADAGVSGS